MADSTHGYTAGSDAATYWTDDPNAWDGSDATAATRDIPAASGKEVDYWLKATTNASSGSGDITNVEIGIHHHGETTNIIPYLVPVFDGSTDGSEYPLANSVSPVTEFVDITSDGNAPSSWSWNDVSVLDIKAYFQNTHPSQPRFAYIYEYYVRVTYSSGDTPISEQFYYRKSGTTYSGILYSTNTEMVDYLQLRVNGSTAYAAMDVTASGNPNASDLRVRKGGITYSILTSE